MSPPGMYTGNIRTQANEVKEFKFKGRVVRYLEPCNRVTPSNSPTMLGLASIKYHISLADSIFFLSTNNSNTTTTRCVALSYKSTRKSTHKFTYNLSISYLRWDIAVKMPKKEFKVVSPWKFMGGLALDDANQMRRVMVRIHNAYKPAKPAPNIDKFTFGSFPAHKREPIEERIKELLNEAEGKELLTEMLKWFGKHYEEEKDGDVVLAARKFSDRVTWFVRNPTLYKVEVEQEKEKWGEFMAGRAENNGSVDSGLSERQGQKTTAKESKQIVIRAKSVSEDEELEEEAAVEDDSGSEYEP